MALRLPKFRNPFSDPDNYADLAQEAGEFLDPRPFVSDAWWSATHPRERLLQQGRAANPQMAFPLGGKYTPRTPGWKMERAETGDPWLNFTGEELRHRPSMFESRVPGEPNYYINRENIYNVRNEKDELVGSASTYSDPRRKGQKKDIYIASLYVKPEHRKSSAFTDLLNVATHGGTRNPAGSIVNERLKRVFERRFNPEREKVLRTVEKAKLPPKPPKRATQLDRDIHELRLAAESGRGRQVVNRDIAHPLTPIRRPPPPRPPRQPLPNPVQQQRDLAHELRMRRRGGV